MGQDGKPGRDFGTNEDLTALKLREWIRNAHWENLSYSDAPPGMIAMFNQTAAAPESAGNLWFNPRDGMLKVYTSRGWLPAFQPFSWYTRHFTQRFIDPYGPMGLEVDNAGVDLGDAQETNTASYTLGNMQINEGYRVSSGWRGEPYVLGVRQESCVTLHKVLVCGAGPALCMNKSGGLRDDLGIPIAMTDSAYAGSLEGVTTASDRPTFAFGVWMEPSMYTGLSLMGLAWTLDGPLHVGYQA
jgi:hypothetical protein